jgi:hypothetical protein
MPHTEPAEVKVINTDPIPVKGPGSFIQPPAIEAKLGGVRAAFPLQNQDIDPSIPAQTTYQEDLNTAGQRHINLIWESTQGQIAKYVIIGTMATDGISILLSLVLGKDFTAAQALGIGFVNSLATGVISFYFSRTNHTQIGGIGPKPNEEYKGR